MYLEAVIERVLTCTLRSWWCELGGRNTESFEIYFDAVIERVWRCSWRPWLCALGGRNLSSLEIHLEAVIKRVWRYTWRPWSSEIGEILGAGQSGGGSSGGRHNDSWDTIHWSARNCGNVENWVQHGLLRDERLDGCRRQSILGWCRTQCMQYSVYAVLVVCFTRCELLSMAWRDREWWLNFVFLGDGRVEDEKERD